MRNRLLAVAASLLLGLTAGAVAATPAQAYYGCGAFRYTMSSTSIKASDGLNVYQANGFFYYDCGGVVAGRMVSNCAWLRVVFDSHHMTEAKRVCGSQQVLIDTSYWNGSTFALQQVIEGPIIDRTSTNGTLWF